jgi:hypothetical protein
VCNGNNGVVPVRGEPRHAVARASHVPTDELEEWRRVFVDGGTQSLQKRRDPGDRELKCVEALFGLMAIGKEHQRKLRPPRGCDNPK